MNNDTNNCENLLPQGDIASNDNETDVLNTPIMQKIKLLSTASKVLVSKYIDNLFV